MTDIVVADFIVTCDLPSSSTTDDGRQCGPLWGDAELPIRERWITCCDSALNQHDPPVFEVIGATQKGLGSADGVPRCLDTLEAG